MAAVRPALAQAIAEGRKSALVLGALPFHPSARPRLALYREVLTGAQATAGAVGFEARELRRPDARVVARAPTNEAYLAAVRAALRKLEAHELEKVVLARCVDLQFSAALELGPLLAALLRQNPGMYVFSMPLRDSSAPFRDAGQEASWWVGASPELLISKRGENIVSRPLAGTAARSADASEDARRGAALERCEKNRREHARVVDAVASALSPYCEDLNVSPAPSLVPTSTLWHLGSVVSGRLRNRDVDVLELARALHPTPAVCGVPRDLARAAIRDLEGFDRELYGGLVGYCDAEGDGEWSVAIRCARIGARSARVYAGAGIVTGSEPQLELRETAAKLGTMLAALNLSQLEAVG